MLAAPAGGIPRNRGDGGSESTGALSELRSDAGGDHQPTAIHLLESARQEGQLAEEVGTLGAPGGGSATGHRRSDPPRAAGLGGLERPLLLHVPPRVRARQRPARVPVSVSNRRRLPERNLHWLRASAHRGVLAGRTGAEVAGGVARHPARPRCCYLSRRPPL